MAEKKAVLKMKHRQNARKANRFRKISCDKFFEHVKYCFSIASIQGLNQIVWSNRSPLERLFWIFVVVGLTIFGSTIAYEIFRHYDERPVITTVEMDYRNWENEFPSFTLCQRELEEKYLESHNISKDSEMYQYLNDLAFANYTNYHLYEKYANGSKEELLKPEEYLETLLEAVPTIQDDPNNKDKNIFPLGQERPIPKIITEIGICSTLNPSNGIYYTPEYFNSSAPYKYEPIIYGYKFLSLKFELRNFAQPYQIAMHSPNDVIGIGTLTDNFRSKTIAIFTVSILSVWAPELVKSLNSHQRGCKLFHEAEDLDHSPVYTHYLCKMECRIKLCLKYCNCTPYYYRRNHGEKICNMTGMYCLSKYTDELLNLSEKGGTNSLCNCQQSCYTTMVYIEDISSTSWITDSRMTISILKHPDVRLVRKLVFTRLDLLVQIGGILGLCLGGTILSVIEVIYFMTLRFYWGVIRDKSIKSPL